MVLPSAAPEVGSALSLQKSQNVLDKEEEKKTLMKKMMVRKQLAGLWHQGGEGAEVLSPPTDEAGLGWGGVGRGHQGTDIWTWVSAPP